MISHNKEFYSSVCKEEWHVGGGKVTVEGSSIAREMKAVARKKKFEKEDDEDTQLEKAGGNTNAVSDSVSAGASSGKNFESRISQDAIVSDKDARHEAANASGPAGPTAFDALATLRFACAYDSGNNVA